MNPAAVDGAEAPFTQLLDALMPCGKDTNRQLDRRTVAEIAVIRYGVRISGAGPQLQPKRVRNRPSTLIASRRQGLPAQSVHY